ncbi:MarR family winged helix-turn-helix transcriptional regulator [Rhizobium pusense]|uniref:MarR family winged helix-turn-helix transcriptional regulator n=1 Tax=Agrobacterium pusense TaxID=648995 RepID=UPI000D1A4093|nr:MarR family winged helix-turn-helix transcriptional regulator [Agrobacterium pusense]MDH0910487.1 MarR family winged helix-turn-helix transcriptional regulator [Agrobacterium pusense]MDH1098346.1 MarR family winged helix-turn-helix transcriptional regulator [Agrobacterium pusense]MDH1114508.1 MarR family winged helix-turn-helix transcriptional regulator [Agrobacterium pusense]MDH2195728.1 MarR family winged helix-turn-helix transcriptional regulator [Agrobacterium pusense]
METPKHPTSVNHRIQESLSRVAVAMRSDDWNRAKAAGLKPAQLSILETLQGRKAGMGVKQIAVHFAVTQPSASDSINALERKGLVEKRTGSDKRAVVVCLTTEGREVLTSSVRANTTTEQAVDTLTDHEQEELLISLVKMIRHLQDIDVIPIQRMCATCRYFVPFKHTDAAHPHHCNVIDASFGQRDIRIDCCEHETADPVCD